jgi:hypothetical protein
MILYCNDMNQFYMKTILSGVLMATAAGILRGTGAVDADAPIDTPDAMAQSLAKGRVGIGNVFFTKPNKQKAFRS